MAFYYLHQHRTDRPTVESGYKYLIYSANTPDSPIELSIEPGVDYCVHQATGKSTWNYDDREIIVTGNLDRIIAKFIKVSDELGFTVWKNENFK